MPTAMPATRCFSEHELLLLAKTADALTAYLGQPMLAEVGVAENGCEWVAYARPLQPGEALSEDDVRVQMGGADARWVGNVGGLDQSAVYDCLYLWGIQISEPDHDNPPAERFVKLDHAGEVWDSADDLADLLPFALGEANADDASAEEDDNQADEHE